MGVKSGVLMANFTPSRSGYKDPDPGPGEPNQCGSMRIRIRNTGYKIGAFILLAPTQL